MKENFYISIFHYLFIAIFAINYTSCTPDDKQKVSVTGDHPVKSGKELAKQYCGSCHAPVSPELLDKSTWINNVLPAMAPMLGIRVWGKNEYYPSTGDQNRQAIAYNDWMNIVNYFEEEAPDTLIAGSPPAELKNGSSKFIIEKPSSVYADSPFAMTTMAKIDPVTGNIYTSGASHNSLIQWDKKLRPDTIMTHLSPSVEINFLNNDTLNRQAVLTNIGTMKAADISRGIVQIITMEQGAVVSNHEIASELTRPLKSFRGDFNNDGLEDWVICVFGHTTGGLYLYEQQPDQSYVHKTIREVPGAIDAEIKDFNDDGWLDLMVLFAYDDEGIWLFTNKKGEGFEEKNLLRFPPVYGSTSFQLIDLNDNGLKDIVYTNGDNADFTRILKPYHGLRIFLNRGDFEYEETYFYPVNGAFEAIVEDFNNNGKPDIITIAFFADFKYNSAESLIYFEQGEDLLFEPYEIPVSKHGRWIAMDAADIDDDGYTDLVLANFSSGLIIQDDFTPIWDTETPFILLKNNLYKPGID